MKKGQNLQKKKSISHPRRHIEDLPFYRFEYQPDDLPMDPAKGFLIEKISRMQEDTIVGKCNVEMNFHSYKRIFNDPSSNGKNENDDGGGKTHDGSGNSGGGNSGTLWQVVDGRQSVDGDDSKGSATGSGSGVDDVAGGSGEGRRSSSIMKHNYENSISNESEMEIDVEDIVLPRKFDLIKNQTKLTYSFGPSADNDRYPWLGDQYTGEPSEERVQRVTNEILRLYRKRRVRIFHENVRTEFPLFSNELQQLHGGASDTIGSFYSPWARNLRLPALGKRRKVEKFKAGDHYALRTPKELKAELERMGNVIDKLIEPVVKKAKHIEAEKGIIKNSGITQLKCLPKGTSSKNNTKVQPKRRIPLSTEEFMKSLKQKDRESFKYKEGFLPVDPEEQKNAISKSYQDEMNKTMPKFTIRVQRRTMSLMDNLSVTQLEIYPSKLIKKLLPKISAKISYLREAYKFILQEEKLWPHVYPEVILMDYLFNSDHRVQQDAAILIISCLIDLQEDFRYHVKRAFLRYILKSEFERKKLQLEIEPPEFPIMTIRAPVPWKALVQIARNRLDQVLMINHPVLEGLNVLWYQLYNDILILDMSKLYSPKIPLNADEILEFVRNSCLAARDILLNDWLPRAADMVDAMKKTWKHFIPMHSPCKGRAGIFFKCIHSLMSLQLRGLLQRSIDHLFKALKSYMDGNHIDEYDLFHPKLKRRPFMTIIVSVVGKHFEPMLDAETQSTSTIYKIDPSDPRLFQQDFKEATMCFDTYFPADFILKYEGRMFVYPYMRELPDLFIGFIRSILRVGYEIPCLEYLMSQGKWRNEDEFGYLHCIHETHIDMLRLYEDVRKIVEANWTGPTVYLYPIYDYYFPLLTGKMLTIAEKVFAQNKIPDLPAIEDLMGKLKELVEGTYFLKDFVSLNMFMLDNRHVNQALGMLVQDVIDFITNYFMTLNLNENRRICDELEEMSMKAGERPEETAEVVALQNYLAECRDERIFKIKDDIKVVSKRVLFLLQYTNLNSDDIRLNTRTFLLPSELELVLDLSAARLNVVRDNLEVALREKRSLFEKYIASQKTRMDGFRMKETHDILSLEELQEKVDTVNELYDTLEKCSKEAKAINVEEGLLQIDVSVFPKLADIIEKMEPIEKLWKTAFEFEKSHEIWMYGPFENLNADVIRDEVENMHKIIHKLTRQLSSNAVAKRAAEQIRVKLDKFKVYIPALDAICRQGLEQRHWDLISEKLGKPCNPSLYPSLKDMIDVNIMSILPALEEVANSAGKEFELNSHLVAMQREWEDVRFEVIQYRDSDTHILAALDDIQTILDDQVMKSQAMRRSPFIVALGTKADDWEAKLVAMLDIMDAWTQVQATWMYLEPIFSSEDIMRQMPVEGRNFKSVDKIWRKVMKHTYQHPGVIEATDYPNLLQVFRKALEDLECVQKGLNTYLEQKRLFFARFFFLSNDELLEILSETKDPLRVQPHLKKCFEGIDCLTFDDNLEITAMISAEGEVVKLIRKINPQLANGLVEIWLKEVETVMLDSVHEQMKSAWDDYYQVERKSWVTAWPGQVVQGISCLAWTYEVEEAIEAADIPGYLTKSNVQIGELVQLVRTDLTTGARITIEALIVLDVHARDVVKYMIDQKVTTVNEFDWISQLRYYWKVDNKIEYVAVSMVVTEVKYGMEYLGNISRLVVTPLTDRCYRTLMGALKLCLGGAPEGPAGTGKTETCKDLAKSVAKKCVVFNCSDGLDYKALGKFFKGLAQSGAWACFDEFNRIELEVLSVVAQQILTIQRAIARRVVKFFFEDTMLKLDPTCSIFITMNPGYAGRTELPDNLKVLFRTVAMMVPDYAMIGEITLYSNGFDDARPLAQKIVHTYKLCSEQLSSQSHYDYGMRAVKSVLLASASLRRMHPNLPEAQIVLRAIVDVNLPKFLDQDVSLFVGIYTDLFPGVDLPEPSRDDLLKWMRKILEERNLQATPWYVEKILQIYEMLLVRHGLMIVGGPMGGKTTAYQVLAQAMKCVSTDQEATLAEYPINYRIINPKAITMGQLYGCFDPISHEWTDGVLAKTFREMANASLRERHWVLFDGPVDAVWIENLNTVLDDNKKLCLMSGEIVQMTKMMNMIFEPADLEQASPATVSRCGMIYMEPAQLGWRVFHQSFTQVLETTQGLNDIYMALYEDLVNWLVPAALEVLQECKSMLETSPIYQYTMLSKFFLQFLEEKNQTYNQIWFQQTFLFSFAWAYGSALTVEGQKHFDSLIRKVLYGSNENYPRPKYFSLNRGQMFPEKLSLMDYRFDGIENWWPWQRQEDITFPEGVQISDIIVPTKETGYINFWLDFCTERKLMPFMVIGPTGTGKSAIISHNLLALPKNTHMLNIVNFSARTSAQLVQETVMSKLDRRRKGVFGPPVGKKCLVFCDDVGMPSKDTYGSQPPLELVRQWLDHGYWSDLDDTSKLELIDMGFVGAMGPVGGSNFIFPRFYRHTFVVAVDAFEDATITKIFTTIGDWHFAKDYADKVALLSKGLAEAMVNIYRQAISVFLPTPAKSHYTFSLRDITRVFTGIVLVPPKRLPDPEKLGRLWAHETYRVFYDRLIEQQDRELLLEMARNACKSHLRFSLEQAMEERIGKGAKLTDDDLRNLFFGNYMEPDAEPKIYDEVESYDKLEKVMQYYLKEYNAFSNTPMDLVLFRFAIEHISRVSRILQMPRGNILMVGMGGSGRRSAAKLAAHIADAKLMTIQVTKTYSMADWRDDLRKILMTAGFNLNHTVFLFSDSQAVDEGYVEDINGILNTGDLPNLYQSEDKAAIMENMTNIAKQMAREIDPSPIEMYGYFIERVREQLHVALAFSPIGDSFKERLRMYPSLINCCTIDWYMPWPVDALVRVAEHFISSMNLNKAEEEDASVDELHHSPRGSQASIGPEKELVLSVQEQNLVQMVMYFNVSVVDASEKCFRELGRRNYVTPTSYLEMLKAFKSFYSKKLNEITQLRDRYTIGLEKLDFAAGQVGEMQANLYDLQPKLKVLSEETEKIMVNIERETAEAEKKKEVVGADEAAANEAAAAAQAIKDDCESDLQEAIPAMEAALEALNTLKPADIYVVKSMKNPPYGVKLVLEAVCVIKGIKPDRKPDPSGRMVEDYWGPSQKMLGDMKFLESLKTFDKDNIPPPIIKRIREKYISDRDFIPEKIKSASTACEGLCHWVRAMDVYDKVAKIVAPKKLALAEAEGELSSQMEKLNAKRAELQEILDKLQKLNDYFAEKSREKKRLEDDIDNCEKRLNRAEKLLGGLGGEKTRWSETANRLHESIHNIVGDVLLAAGCIAYLGFFPTEYRVNILTEWNSLCITKDIPCTEKFLLATTLGNPMQIRAWSLAGLPSDNFSVENAIIVANANRYPLMIDPQVQANKWIKNMEKDNDLKVIKQSDDNYMRVIELAISYGNPVLIENVGEKLDSNLTPILERNVIRHKGGYVIKCGDQMIEYNHNFRMYITTCLRNPLYPPETMVMVTILNFMITEQGLREQLLANVVAHERPDLQEKKEQLIIESAKNRDALYNIESKILEVLSTSEGNVLEDENAINILSSSKILSEEIQEKQIIAVATETEIDAARQQYIPVAKHSAILFFCISELANIDPMYQYSLGWFLNLFVNAILKAPKSKVLDERLAHLNDFFTKSIYVNVCRSLFEKDKLVISMVMCLGILVSQDKIDKSHLVFFLTGGVGLKTIPPNPAPGWLPDKAWTQIFRASDLNGLNQLHQEFTNNIDEWKSFYDLSSPELATFPAPYHNAGELISLILLKCIRPDKIVPAIRDFITRNMDQSFVEPPPFDLHSSFADSSPTIPLVFLLSPGSDPMASLFMYAKQRNMYDKTKTISLGQGQGPRAEKMIIEANRFGHWVVLQNCHVAVSWMGELERICNDGVLAESAHPDYRLWCTSYPSQVFPVSVLQNSVKMTNEPPKGLKMNMMRSFNSDPLVRDKFFSKAFIGKPNARKCWLRGVFALVFFHAIVQERREFGPLGWNIPYEFNESDLKISLLQLKMFLKQSDSIPFQGHIYLTGECNYGGRVTDDKDRRLILSLLNTIYNPDAIEIDNYPLSQSGDYCIPENPARIFSVDYISSFPLSPHPEVFGLHENADINRNNKETNSLLQGVLLTQTELLASTRASSATDTAEDPAYHVCKEILSRLPQPYDIEEVSRKYPVVYTNSMNTVLRQELIRFNRLLDYLRKSLNNVQKAVQGQIAMIPELERVHSAMIVGQLPRAWLSKSYPSLKPLASYISDFLARLQFFQRWIDHGEPTVYWLSGFYFTQSFITGVLQNYSRKHRYQIDLIGVQFNVTNFETDQEESPELGAYVKGLFLEGARWNRELKCLDESFSKILFDTLPIILMMPVLKSEAGFGDDDGVGASSSSSSSLRTYDCPIYKTSERRGVLSTTGHSTNFVMYIQLKSKVTSTHWINRGTACLCQLDD
ncbi:dynein axonemal heavy chain 3 isoform X1 [Episyrphus balteatus]|uniref:dynein axonemal heavy chain 3 isoform X1 n=1 Tax=Episyrphus balteatus TaxID=286459 RepID=UPI0024869377|nr:dynein axonemal heavy chain 3 isoform X1 [Episyrphus balteatus]